MDWTTDEWENLERLSNALAQLLAQPYRQNRAWQAKLRICIATIAMYQDVSDQAFGTHLREAWEILRGE